MEILFGNTFPENIRRMDFPFLGGRKFAPLGAHSSLADRVKSWMDSSSPDREIRPQALEAAWVRDD